MAQAESQQELKAEIARWQAIANQGIQIERDLRIEIERLREGLQKIADIDYRGNRSPESVIARNVLRQAK